MRLLKPFTSHPLKKTTDFVLMLIDIIKKRVTIHGDEAVQ